MRIGATFASSDNIDFKNMKFLFVIFCLVVTICSTHSVLSTNYCKVQCFGYKHIGCKNDGKLKRTCPKKASKYEFSSSEIKYILKLHNEYRNKICSGSIRGYQPCKRAAKMVWDKELAELAGMNTRTCIFSHDACRNTDKYPASGQNIASVSWYSSHPDVKKTIYQIVHDLWFIEYKDASMKHINRYHDRSDGKMIGHFTQIVNDKSVAVGCGATLYYSNEYDHFYMACNYANGNIFNLPIYAPSQRGGSGCLTGRDKTYKALCSSREKFLF